MYGFSEYQAALCSSVYPISLAPLAPAETFFAELHNTSLGNLAFARAKASAPFLCTRQPVRRSEDNAGLLLKLQEKGSTSYIHLGKKLHCDAGSIVMLNCHDSLEGEQHGPAENLVVKLPGDLVSVHAQCLSRRAATVIDARSGTGKLLAFNLRELGAFCTVPLVQARMLSLALLGLVEAAFHDASLSRSTRDKGTRDEKMLCLRAAITRDIADTDLSVDRLCRSLGMSRSSLYLVTKACGMTVERLILEVRLDAARASFENPAYMFRSITDIAFSVGFRDCSHFSRAFKARFNMSPVRFRDNQIKMIHSR